MLDGQGLLVRRGRVAAGHLHGGRHTCWWRGHRARRVGILLDVLHVLLRSGLGHSLALAVSATLTRALGSREEPGGYAVNHNNKYYGSFIIYYMNNIFIYLLSYYILVYPV